MAVLGRKKTCPDCAERVAAAAKVCRYCGYRFPVEEVAADRAVTARATTAAQSPPPTPAPAQPTEPAAPPVAPPPERPAEAGQGDDSIDTTKLGPAHELRVWGFLAKLALVGIAAAAAYMLYAALHQADLLDRFISSNPADRPSLSQIATSDHDLTHSANAFLAAYVIGGLLFIGFFRDAYVNLARFGARGFRFSFNQAAWAWFIPFFNLVRPKQIANDIWRGSQNFDQNDPSAWRAAPVGSLVDWWWAVYLISGAGTYASSQAYSSSDSLPALRDALYFEAGFRALQVVALILAFVFVSRILRGQEPWISQAIRGGRG